MKKVGIKKVSLVKILNILVTQYRNRKINHDFDPRADYLLEYSINPNIFFIFILFGIFVNNKTKLEDLTVLKRSPDLLNNVKIGQDQLRIMKHILFYEGCSHFGQVT